jgi:hypothetical protein
MNKIKDIILETIDIILYPIFLVILIIWTLRVEWWRFKQNK